MWEGGIGSLLAIMGAISIVGIFIKEGLAIAKSLESLDIHLSSEDEVVS